MKLKKFGQFLESLDSNPVEPVEIDDNEYDTPEDFKKELDEEDLDRDFEDDTISDEFSDDDEGMMDTHIDDTIDDFDYDSDEEGEEEGHEYEGTLKMRELADELGVEVIDNKIEYEGKTIHYYSETDSFHIGKDKFKTKEEVLDFLNDGDSTDIEDDTLSPNTDIDDIDDTDWSPQSESFKYLKKFK